MRKPLCVPPDALLVPPVAEVMPVRITLRDQGHLLLTPPPASTCTPDSWRCREAFPAVGCTGSSILLDLQPVPYVFANVFHDLVEFRPMDAL